MYLTKIFPEPFRPPTTLPVAAYEPVDLASRDDCPMRRSGCSAQAPVRMMKLNTARMHAASGAQGALLATGRFGRVMGYWAQRDIGLHTHDEIQMTFNLGGGLLNYRIDDAPVVVKPGQGVAIPAWVKHSRYGDPRAPTYVIVMAISPAWLHAHRRAGCNISGDRGIFTIPVSLKHILAHLRLALTNASLDAPEQVAALVDALIDGVSPMDSPAPLFTPVSPRGCWDKRIIDAANRIQKCNGRTVVDHLSKEYGLSRSHFYSRFSAHFGFSPQLLINAVRMKTALHLLLEGDVPIATISDTLGFSVAGHFTRFFTKHTGETPTSFRTRNVTLESL
jgi:AraC-like DNA-binding protein